MAVVQTCTETIDHCRPSSFTRADTIRARPHRDSETTKADLDGLIGRLRRGEVPGRKRWSARSVNYMLYLCTAVLDDQVAQGNAVRNVAKLVDRIAGEAGEMRTLTERDMFRILDHECRDRHLWALALYGLRRGEIAGLRWTNVDLNDPDRFGWRTASPWARRSCPERPNPKPARGLCRCPMKWSTCCGPHARDRLRSRLACGSAYGSGEYVASDEFGQPYHPNLLTFRWGRMLDGLSIERVRLHDARHSCATLMHIRQVPIAVRNCQDLWMSGARCSRVHPCGRIPTAAFSSAVPSV
jgi:integrase